MTGTNQKFRLIPLPVESSFEEVTQFDHQLNSLIKQNGLPVVINCENTDMIFSTGLGIIIDAYKKCNKEKVLFAVVNINKAIQTIIQDTRLDKVINVYPTLEEYEISEFEDGLVGTKVPPLDFSYVEAELGGHRVFTCKGVMCEGPTMTQLMSTLKNLETAVFNFSNLGFIDADCLDDFTAICQDVKIYVYGANDVIKDEFKLFEIERQIVFKSTLNEIQQILGLK